MIKCTNEYCIYNDKNNKCYLKNVNPANGICTSFTSENIFEELKELYKRDVEKNRIASNYYSVKNSMCDNEFCIYNKKKQCILNNRFKTQDGSCPNFIPKDSLDNTIKNYEKILEQD